MAGFRWHWCGGVTLRFPMIDGRDPKIELDVKHKCRLDGRYKESIWQ